MPPGIVSLPSHSRRGKAVEALLHQLQVRARGRSTEILYVMEQNQARLLHVRIK